VSDIVLSIDLYDLIECQDIHWNKREGEGGRNGQRRWIERVEMDREDG